MKWIRENKIRVEWIVLLVIRVVVAQLVLDPVLVPGALVGVGGVLVSGALLLIERG